MSDIFIPQVQLGFFGFESRLTTIPPEYLEEFVYVNKLGDTYTATATFFDPTYEKLEEALLTSEWSNQKMKNTGRLVARIGVNRRSASSGAMEIYWSPFLNFTMMNVNPNFGEAGAEVTLELHAWILNQLSDNLKPRNYIGKRSSVFSMLFNDLGVPKENIFSEETDDDFSTENVPGGDANNMTYCSKGMSYQAFVAQRLIPGARSKATGRTGYEFQLREDGKSAVFAPPNSDTWNSKIEKKILSFNYLLGSRQKGYEGGASAGGINNDVISFSPEFKSNMLGSIGAGSSLCRHYNPHTKKYGTFNLNYKEVQNVLTLGNKTHLSEKLPPIVLTRNSGYDESVAKARAYRTWNMLFDTVYEADIELVGSEKTLGITGGDVINLSVITPSGNYHYSSGMWLVREATHRVTDSYTVRCHLSRNFGNTGAEGLSVDQEANYGELVGTIKSVGDFLGDAADLGAEVVGDAGLAFQNMIDGILGKK